MSEYRYRTINGKRVPEHRAVVEELLGITLQNDQVVHHINGDKKDNRPENLQILDWREDRPDPDQEIRNLSHLPCKNRLSDDAESPGR